MKLGAENKRNVIALGVVLVVGVVVVYETVFSGPSTPTATPTRAVLTVEETTPSPNAKETSPGPDISRASVQVVRSRSGKNGEFHPVLRSKKKEDRIDLATADPSLRLDLLAKVMKVPAAGGERDLFQLSKTAPVTQVATAMPPKEPKVVPFVGPRPLPPPAPPPPPPGPEPVTPIPLKYFGYAVIRPDGKRTAYFLDGDDQQPVDAIEGTILKGRYKVLQIGADKVLFEDTQKNRRQSVNLEPEGSG